MWQGKKLLHTHTRTHIFIKVPLPFLPNYPFIYNQTLCYIMNGPINDRDLHTLQRIAKLALCLPPCWAWLHVEAIECPSAALARPSSALLRPCAAVTGSHWSNCSNKCVHIAVLASSPLLAENLLSCPPPYEEKDFDCARGESLGGRWESETRRWGWISFT